jgi:hypothetical protein
LLALSNPLNFGYGSGASQFLVGDT